MKECSQLATIRTFEPFDIVYSANNDQIDNSVFIVLSGRCSILQYLNMNSRSDKNVYNLKPPIKKQSASNDIIQQIFGCNDNEEKMLKDSSSRFDLNDCGSGTNVQAIVENKPSGTIDEHTRAHFVEIGEFSCGSMFGLGEHMDDRVIVAKQTGVQCLLIPHYWLFQKKQNAGNIWQRAKIYLDFTLPSRQKVFKHYLEAKHWKSYKNKLIHNSGKLRPQINSTQIEDVPLLCRLNDSI